MSDYVEHEDQNNEQGVAERTFIGRPIGNTEIGPVKYMTSLEATASLHANTILELITSAVGTNTVFSNSVYFGSSSTFAGDVQFNANTNWANTSNARANLGVSIGSQVQGWDADLDAIAALATTGILSRTASNTWAHRTLTGTSNQITVTNGDGVSGNPTISLPSSVTFPGSADANDFTASVGGFTMSSLTNYYISPNIGTGNPGINFDGGDYIDYNRSSNTLRFSAGGTVIASFTSSLASIGATTFSGAVTVSSNKITLTGGGGTGSSGMSNASGSLGGVEIQNNGTGAAMITFHRTGAFATYFGLDTDNVLKYGGWSEGAVAYTIWTQKNAGTPQGLATTNSPTFAGLTVSSTLAVSTGSMTFYGTLRSQNYAGNANLGIIYLSQNDRYLYYNGGAYVLGGAPLAVDTGTSTFAQMTVAANTTTGSLSCGAASFYGTGGITVYNWAGNGGLGLIFFGNTGGAYHYWDGATHQLVGGPLLVASGTSSIGALSVYSGEFSVSGSALRSTTVRDSTTSSSANVFIGTGGVFQKFTSSIKYKTDVETMQEWYVDNLLDNARPVWYRSTCTMDNPSWGHWGFIAEELALIDPRVVFYNDDDTPEGVMYDRIVPALVYRNQKLKAQIADMQDRLNSVETRLAALEAA